MSLKRLILAAVPEQVNIPLLLCSELGIFKKYGLELVHKVVPEGTGVMIDLLEKGEVDIAFTVTDGAIVAKANQKKINLIGTYVNSPLIWAVAGSGKYKTMHDLNSLPSLRIGISRYGSGSHTMAYYMSKKYQLACYPHSLSFFPVNNINGLREGIKNDIFDIFLWEKFTTKPYFDSGELHMVGEVPTPWTAFSIICQQDRTSDPIFQQSIKQCFYPALREGIQLFIHNHYTSIVQSYHSIYTNTNNNNNQDNLNTISTTNTNTISINSHINASLNDNNSTNDSKSNNSSNDSKVNISSIDRICLDHGHMREDALAWLESVKYGIHESDTKYDFAIDCTRTQHSIEVLQDVGLVSQDFNIQSLYGENNHITEFV